MTSVDLFPLQTAAEARPYGELTYPRFRPLLDRLDDDPGIVAVAAAALGCPVGLALAQVRDDAPGAGVIRSVYVAPSLRGAGLGTALLAQAEAALLARNCRRAALVYSAGKATTPGFERVLAKRGWATPERNMLLAEMPIKTVRDAPRAGLAPLPEPFRTMPWTEITAAQREALAARQAAERWIPAPLWPGKWEEGAEPRTSLGLLREDEVVGWMLTHELGAGRLQFSCGWVREELQRLAHIRPFLRLLADSAEKADVAGYELGVWYVSAREQRMAAFTVKRMARLGGRVNETMRTHKSLDPQDSNGAGGAGDESLLEAIGRGHFDQLR